MNGEQVYIWQTLELDLVLHGDVGVSHFILADSDSNFKSQRSLSLEAYPKLASGSIAKIQKINVW